jgi:RNA polymerase sigma-70 factor (ECF subfamily)
MPLPLPADDTALIAQAQRGSLEAFNALVLTHQQAVFSTAYRLMGTTADADDAAQQTFVTAFQRLSTFRGGSFRAWLLRICSNQCYDAMRRERARPQVGLSTLSADADDEPPIADDAPQPEARAEQRELQRVLQACIDQLGPDQKIALVLSDLQELDYQAIAEQTGAALGTVKSRVSRARASVRDCLQAARELLPAKYRL